MTLFQAHGAFDLQSSGEDARFLAARAASTRSYESEAEERRRRAEQDKLDLALVASLQQAERDRLADEERQRLQLERALEESERDCADPRTAEDGQALPFARLDPRYIARRAARAREAAIRSAN